MSCVVTVVQCKAVRVACIWNWAPDRRLVRCRLIEFMCCIWIGARRAFADISESQSQGGKYGEKLEQDTCFED